MFLEMAEQRLGHAMLFLIVETKLDGIVAVGLDGFGLDDAIGAGENDGDGCQDSVGVIDAGLAEFFS
jgi:hypothetical protein